MIKESGPFAELKREINRLSREVDSLRLMTSDTVKVRRSSLGTLLDITVKPGKGTTTSGMRYRGEWSPNVAYEVDDVVNVRGGITAGLYICVSPTLISTAVAPQDPPADPSQGIFWIMLAPGYTIGQWT